MTKDQIQSRTGKKNNEVYFSTLVNKYMMNNWDEKKKKRTSNNTKKVHIDNEQDKFYDVCSASRNEKSN